MSVSFLRCRDRSTCPATIDMVDEILPSSLATCVAIAGQAARLETVVRAHYKFVFRLLRRLGLRRIDAEDAAQQVFVMLARKLELIRPGAELPVVYQIACGVAANHRRRLRRRKVVVLSTDRVEKAPCPRPRAPERLEACELLDEVLATMPVELRIVFILSEIEQSTAPAIARIQSVPLGTVASRLRRARALFLQNARMLSAPPEGRGES